MLIPHFFKFETVSTASMPLATTVFTVVTIPVIGKTKKSFVCTGGIVCQSLPSQFFKYSSLFWHHYPITN